MMKTIEWRHLWCEGATERLRLEGRYARGRVECERPKDPFEVSYDVRWDARWRTRFAECRVTDGGRSRFKGLVNDGEGRWAVDGQPDRRLDGCIDVDIWPTPFTNTLVIRRLLIEGLDAADVLVAWIDALEGTVRARPQRYTRTAAGWRFESIDDGFSAQLTVDDDGLVVDYPGFFERIAADA